MWSSGINVLKSFLGSEELPNKVLEAKPDTFSSRGICHREDGLILYLPNTNTSSKKDKPNFEIVLHRPATESSHQTFSLYRSFTRDEAELKFFVLKDKLPDFIEIAREMCNVIGLQKICDTLFEHPQWSLAHLAAHFALHDCLSNPKISNYLNSTDGDTGMSPLQVAIVTKNLKTVQILVDAKCSLEHLDNKNNSVYHYAASTTKEIISETGGDFLDNDLQKLNLFYYSKSCQLAYNSIYPQSKAEKSKKFVSLSYFGHLTEKVANVIPKLNINISFKPQTKLSGYLFNAKDKSSKFDNSGVYKLICPVL